MLIVALVAGFVAAYAIKSVCFVENEPQAVDDGTLSGLTEQLLVANGDLSAGSELSALNVRLELTPEEKVPRDGIFSFNGVSGRKITRDLKDGEPVSLYDLEELDQEETSSTGFVPPGCSIVPIVISSATKENGNRNYLKTTKLNKMIKTGDVVDVLVVKEVRSKSGPVALPRLATETVAENVSVFDVSDESRFGADGAVRVSTISALLTADQLEKVRIASDEGKIRVVLHDESAAEPEPSANVATSPNGVSVRAYYPPYEEPRKAASSAVVPSLGDADQPFVISLSDDAQDSGVDSSGTSASVKSEGGFESSAPIGGVAPEQGLINNDFTINLIGGASDFGGAFNSDAIAERPISAAKWNSVDFNPPVVASEPSSSLQDSLWLGSDAFRPRESVVAEERRGGQYERAVAEDLTAEPSDEEDIPAFDAEPLQESPVFVATEENAVVDVPTDAPTVSTVKKSSPFLTVTSKRSTGASEKDKRRYGKRI